MTTNPVNKYPGACAHCGVTVTAMAGTRSAKKIDGRWAVYHREGECGPATPVAYTGPKFPPTPEQAAAVDMFMTGIKVMKIEAVAGAGKTSTLELLAAAVPEKSVQYTAFNAAIAAEVKSKMPPNVKAANVHKLAMAAVGRPYAKRLKAPRMRPAEVARIVGIDALPLADRTLSAEFLAGLAMRAIAEFCKTADPAPTPRHVPHVDAIDTDGEYVANNAVAAHVAPYLAAIWADLSDPGGRLPFRHDHYLKLWQLSDPVIAADVILVDEAQDVSPVWADVVARQTHAQVVYVGDSQQAIYEFTGAINALAGIDADHTATLTRSFRFGPAIADAANLVLADLGADLTVKGSESIPSTVGPLDTEPDAILTRTNAAAIDALLAAQARGVRAHLIGGSKEVATFARAARDLQSGRHTDHPELACFDTWAAVQFFVAEDQQGDELRLLVNLVDQYGADVILAAVDAMPAEGDADLVISTAHKAKGREWDKVLIASDFAPRTAKGATEPTPPAPSELRLRYVAVTRAKLAVDNTAMVGPGAPVGPPADVVAPVDAPAPAEGPEADATPEGETWVDIAARNLARHRAQVDA